LLLVLGDDEELRWTVDTDVERDEPFSLEIRKEAARESVGA
jgi:hypothetical protein